jgi:hypothetical protein
MNRTLLRRLANGFRAAVALLLLAGCTAMQDMFTRHDRMRMVLFDPAALPLTNFDLSSPAFAERNSFGPDEQPAVMIIGSAGRRTLQLVDRGSNRFVGSTDSVRLHFGRVAIQPLDIPHTGEYEAWLSILKIRAISKFSVIRNPPPSAHSETNASQADSFPFRSPPISLAFGHDKTLSGNYDAVLVWLIQKRWYELLDEDPQPKRRGLVKLKFNLHADGHISDVKVAERTMDELYVSTCKRALSEVTPYKPWPEEMRQKISADYRGAAFTFYYD